MVAQASLFFHGTWHLGKRKVRRSSPVLALVKHVAYNETADALA